MTRHDFPTSSLTLPCFYYPATDLLWEICLAYPSLGLSSSALLFLKSMGFLFPVNLLPYLAIPTKPCFSLPFLSIPYFVLPCLQIWFCVAFYTHPSPLSAQFFPSSPCPALLLLLTLISLPVSQWPCLAQPPLFFPALPTRSLTFLSLPTPPWAGNPFSWDQSPGIFYFGGGNPISAEVGS